MIIIIIIIVVKRLTHSCLPDQTSETMTESTRRYAGCIARYFYRHNVINLCAKLLTKSHSIFILACEQVLYLWVEKCQSSRFFSPVTKILQYENSKTLIVKREILQAKNVVCSKIHSKKFRTISPDWST